MSIGSIFTSNERLFAEWMMQSEFNQEIQAEPRFPGENQDVVLESYYTIQEKSPIRLPTKDEKEAMSKSRLARLNRPLEDKQQASSMDQDASLRSDLISEPQVLVSESDDVEIIEVNRENKPAPKQNLIYQIVHGPVVQPVEKKSSPENVEYGNFWGQTRFTKTEKPKGYFLVDGWLVVSVPEKKEGNRYEINDEVNITFAYKFVDDIDPVVNKIKRLIQDWFRLQNEKLTSASQACIAGSALFSVMVTKIDMDGHLFALALPISCIAMYAMTFYVGVKLYNLHCFKDKIDSIKNLGDWVHQIGQYAFAYPDLLDKASHLDNFFTPDRQILVSESHQGACNSIS